ncbi:hypothetical protein E6P97_02290 [Patescibacteria group bacterium]|nr:MAG: hypothetical protein E6P97_02290 [Patescibacteria group bacterium]
MTYVLARGVNLGGWMVLERWITPSLFEGVDAKAEYGLCLKLGSREAKRRIERHRETFITEAHLRQIKNLGLNSVRVPVGYWLFGDETPFVPGGDEVLDRLFVWAKRLSLGVVLVFHAAPGSQNGNDHSGRAGAVAWVQPKNIARSLDFIERLAQRYGQKEALIGIEVLNEPSTDIPLKLLIDYYKRSVAAVRTHSHGGVDAIVSDAFQPKQVCRAIRSARIDAVVDLHLYQVFTTEDRVLSIDGHINKVEHRWARELHELSRRNRIMVGEWSAAMGGSGFGRDDHRRYASAQQQTFEQTGVSWMYWTARTEDRGVWSLLDNHDLIRQ